MNSNDSPRETAIQQALEAIANGISERKAAKDFGVSRSALYDRRTGRRDAGGQESQQRLSRIQEEELCDWIIDQEACGYAPSHNRVREMVVLILKASGDERPLGKKWVHNFLKRNPRVATMVGKPIEASRIRGTQPEQINVFYENFDMIRRRTNVHLDDVWNMDEHGIGLGVCNNTRVLGAGGKRQTYIQSPENREWVSVLECISASGGYIRPLVIFKGKDVQTSWFTENDIPDWLIATSSKGWTANCIALRWLKEVFLPETARKLRNGSQAPRLLILDGHGSHVHVEFMWECRQHNVNLLFLPAHSSHVLQPLDLGTFSPLKSRYRREITDLASLDEAAPVKKRRFVQCYQKARAETFNPRHLRAGWAAAGLYPWNPAKVLNSSQIHVATATASGPPTPSTPKRQRSDIDTIFPTPKHPRDIYDSIKKLGDLNREQRTVLQKASKAIGNLTATQALLEANNRGLQVQLEELQAKKTKKKVAVDPNTLFANIETIKRAMDDAATRKAQQEKEKAQKLAKEKEKGPVAEAEAQRTSRALEKAKMESCMFEWQL